MMSNLAFQAKIMVIKIMTSPGWPTSKRNAELFLREFGKRLPKADKAESKRNEIEARRMVDSLS